jgi:hypothetical protein
MALRPRVLAALLAVSAQFALPSQSEAALPQPAPPAAGPAAALAPASIPPHVQAAALRASRLTQYKARYQVSYRGIRGGELEASLHPATAPNQWIYESRAYPNLLGRIAISPDARQRSTMELTASGVRPLTVVFDDGSDDSAKDVHIAFDWTTGRVSGEAREKAFDLAVTPGTQDGSSITAAMILELLAGHEPKSFWILNGAKLEEYRYWPEGRATVVTPYGQFDTVVWASQRDGSKRLNRVWHAPQLGYVPVQAIQYNKGRPDVQLKLVALELGLSPRGTVP